MSGTGIFQRHYEAVARDIISYCPTGSILDVGTGPGWLLLKLHQQAPGLQITGVDISSGMVARAKQNIARAGLSDLIDVKKGKANDLPFADHTFDTIVSTGSIHHWKEPGDGLNEIYRILKPGGYALIYDLVSDTPKTILQKAAREFGKLRMFLFWLHGFEEPFYSVKSFEALARSTRFKEGQIQFVGVLCCLILKRTQQ